MTTTSELPPLNEIIFPSASTNISKILSRISKKSNSTYNRIHSIARDAEYVTYIGQRFNLPLIANERCGSWYISPARKAGSVYFKSTDGHAGQWSFNLRRLNLALLEIVGRAGGCIIVDSTRKGKHFPDALSKTVPIWCAVMNRLVFPHLKSSHHVERLDVMVSNSEHAQIESRMQGFVEAATALDLDLGALRKGLRKPMRPIWVSRSLNHSHGEDDLDETQNEGFHPVLLCMASEYQEHGRDVLNYEYVQGAADDSESWAPGLTSTLFWSHRSLLLGANEDDLLRLVNSLHKEKTTNSTPGDASCINPATWLYVDAFDEQKCLRYDGLVVTCTTKSTKTLQESLGKRLLHLRCREGKLGSRDLRNELQKLPSFVISNVVKERPTLHITVACDSGNDIAIGVALVILCLLADDSGRRLNNPANDPIDKGFIRRRLAWITSSRPQAYPSRATLNSVNSFLLPAPD